MSETIVLNWGRYFTAFIVTLTTSSQGTSHCNPETVSIHPPSQPHSVAFGVSSLSLAVPHLSPCCFLFTNKSLLCNFCLWIRTHRNDNTILFMILKGRRAWKQYLRRRKLIWWFGPCPQCALNGQTKITSSCCYFIPLDHSMSLLWWLLEEVHFSEHNDPSFSDNLKTLKQKHALKKLEVEKLCCVTIWQSESSESRPAAC